MKFLILFTLILLSHIMHNTEAAGKIEVDLRSLGALVFETEKNENEAIVKLGKETGKLGFALLNILSKVQTLERNLEKSEMKFNQLANVHTKLLDGILTNLVKINTGKKLVTYSSHGFMRIGANTDFEKPWEFRVLDGKNENEFTFNVDKGEFVLTGTKPHSEGDEVEDSFSQGSEIVNFADFSTGQHVHTPTKSLEDLKGTAKLVGKVNAMKETFDTPPHSPAGSPRSYKGQSPSPSPRTPNSANGNRQFPFGRAANANMNVALPPAVLVHG